ncbi:MAG TPA: ATP-binding protein [Polyangiaceae bacterium]|nr:ATP-binding protein [Polyangiaceae bacterium]
MATAKTRLLVLARWGLLLALLALGITLVFSAWSSRREARQLSSLLDRGQSERFFRSIPELHERNHGPATSADLAQLLEQFRDEGLRYLVEYDSAGEVLAEAGTHLGSARPRAAGAPSQPVLFGDRVRVIFRPPRSQGHGPRPDHPPPPGEPHAPRGPHGPDDADGPHGPHDPPGPHGFGSPLPDLVIEFEPTVANQLRDRATKSFVFSITAAISLLALTLGLWLALAREEKRREQSERERQLAALGEMSAVLAHEIRNPLASLKGHAQLLEEQLTDDTKLQKKALRIVDEAKRLEDLTSTLLDLVRSSSVSPTPTDPARLLREAAEAVGAERIRIDSSQAPSSWSLDPMRIDQVLKNLLQNALQASPAEASVEASLRVERGKLVVEIRDHGPGLAEGSEQQIFEPFHTTRVKGTGLGLAVARRIVELHGGQIRGENHAGGGALFKLWLPAQPSS